MFEKNYFFGKNNNSRTSAKTLKNEKCLKIYFLVFFLNKVTEIFEFHKTPITSKDPKLLIFFSDARNLNIMNSKSLFERPNTTNIKLKLWFS